MHYINKYNIYYYHCYYYYFYFYYYHYYYYYYIIYILIALIFSTLEVKVCGEKRTHLLLVVELFFFVGAWKRLRIQGLSSFITRVFFERKKTLYFTTFSTYRLNFPFLKWKEKFTKCVYFIMASFDSYIVTVLAMTGKIVCLRCCIDDIRQHTDQFSHSNATSPCYHRLCSMFIITLLCVLSNGWAFKSVCLQESL